MLHFFMGVKRPAARSTKATDERLLADLVRYTSRSLNTSSPVPFGALIVHSKTGEPLLKALNAVVRENDPSLHAELRAVRKACKKLKSCSLAGYTLYSTCEPCPMCMANALWARLDRVVYGARIEDANRHCRQIRISAKEIVRRSDMETVVEGPVLRELCYSLFTHPKMLTAFSTWINKK